MRQLENICHWLTVMAPAQLVDAKDLPPELQRAGAARRGAPPRCAPAAAPTRRRARDRRPRRAPARRRAAPPRRRRRAVPAADRLARRPRARGARSCCDAGEPMVWDTLTRQFEAQLIHTALEITRGRRIEAAQKLGIGRNTITRKIQELGLDEK